MNYSACYDFVCSQDSYYSTGIVLFQARNYLHDLVMFCLFEQMFLQAIKSPDF